MGSDVSYNWDYNSNPTIFIIYGELNTNGFTKLEKNLVGLTIFNQHINNLTNKFS